MQTNFLAKVAQISKKHFELFLNDVIIEVKLLWLLLGNLRKIVYTIIPIVSNLVILKQLAQSVRYSKNVLQKEIDKSEKTGGSNLENKA